VSRTVTLLLTGLLLLVGCGQDNGAPQSDSSVVGGPPSQHRRHHRPAHHGSRAQPRRTPRAAAGGAGLGPATKTTGCRVQGSLPDPACTPGAVFASATPAQICVSGYTARVRNVSETLKSSIYAAYGIGSHAAGSYEVDHLVPLELGGSNARANLWPERAPGFGRKDGLENTYHAAVCNGTLGLPVAQRRLARNWLRYAPRAPKPTPRPAPKPTPRPAPGPPSSSPSPGGHVTCSTFSSHAQAQSYFQAHQGTAGNLDRDGDGQACESLP